MQILPPISYVGNEECRNSEPKPEIRGTPGMTEKIENTEIN